MSNSASWRIVVGIGILWALILGIGILFMPESPRLVLVVDLVSFVCLNHPFRWLAAHDRMEDAQFSLARSRGISKEEAKSHYIITREFEEIKSSVEYEKQIRGGWIDCFRPQNKTLYRTLLGMSLQSLQQLTGANYFFYYGATVFKAVGLSDSFVTQIILGTVNFVCTFGGMYVLERVSDLVRL